MTLPAADGGSRSDTGHWLRQLATLSPQPWAMWAAIRTIIAGLIVGAVSLSVGGSVPSLAYFAVACATSFSVIGSPEERVRNVAGQAVGAALGLLVAGLAVGSPVAVVIVGIFAGFASGVVERMRSTAVTAGALMLLVAIAFGSFAPLALPAPIQALWYLISSAVVAALAALPIGKVIPSTSIGDSSRGHETWPQALMAGSRLALCFGTGMALASTLDQGRHSFWLPLTIAVVVRSEYGPVAVRVASRVTGTVIGALLATMVILFQPDSIVLAVAAIIGMAFGAFAAPRHYALSVVGITLSALLSGEIGLDERVIPLVRLGDTLLGCLVALVLGHFIWLWMRGMRTEGGTRVRRQ